MLILLFIYSFVNIKELLKKLYDNIGGNEVKSNKLDEDKRTGLK